MWRTHNLEEHRKPLIRGRPSATRGTVLRRSCDIMEDCILRALRSTAPPLPPCPSVAPCNVQRPGRRSRSRSPLGPAPARTVLTPTRDIVADDADEPTANPPLVARDGHQRWLVAAIGVTDAALAYHTPPLPSAILFRDTRDAPIRHFSLQPPAQSPGRRLLLATSSGAKARETKLDCKHWRFPLRRGSPRAYSHSCLVRLGSRDFEECTPHV